MSYFDDASLVMIPSGYKDQKVYSVKPLDGSGDLTFSRASSATRVASNGLIEKVRTNLLLQSNTFSSVSWTNNNATLTSGQADPFGGSNAWKMEATISTQSDLRQTVSGAAGYSIYVKAGNYNFFSLWTGAAGIAFDLSAGTAGAGGTITSVGSGWYRCSVATSTTGSVTLIPFFSANAGDFVYIAFAQAEPTDVPTDYIATTTTAVSVGPVSGLPRLDYLNSTCPRLLLEPQRSSLVLYSEQMDNASWIKLNGAVTANAAVSPDGYTNADKFVPNTTSGIHALRSNLFNQSATAAHSWFVKADGYSKIAVRESELVGNYASFNLSTGAVISTNQTASIVNYGNGWYRCTLVDTTTGANAQTSIVVLPDSYTTGDPIINWSGDGTKGVLAYGAMVELGAYATSYIPTLGTSVTRVADAASKTGISSLIGQTEGTIFFEVDKTTRLDNDYRVQISDGTTNNWLFISVEVGNAIRAYCNVGGVNQFSIYGTAVTSGRHKVAMAYKANDFKVYVDGVAWITHTSGSVPACSRFDVGCPAPGTEASTDSKTAQALLFKTRLTNAQLAELTTL